MSIWNAQCFGWPSPQIEVTWTPQSGATGYEVWRRINGGSFSFYSASYTPDSGYYEYTDSSLSANNNYEYQIRANTSGGTVSSNIDGAVVNSGNCGGSTPPPPPPTTTPTPPPSSCTDDATVTVISGLPSILNPGQTYNFTVRATNTGSTSWYHGSAYQLRQVSGYSISPSYGHLPAVMNPGDWANWTFSFTAPAYSAGTKTISMRMIHNSGWAYSTGCPAPGSGIWFGSAAEETFTLAGAPTPTPVANIGFNVVYSLGTLNTPSGLSAVNSTCGQIRINWQYTNNTVEQYFTVWRGTTSNAATFANVSGNLTPTSLRTWTDTPPAPNTSYYYLVKAHTSIGGTRETQSAVYGPVINQGCTANVGLQAQVTHINGIPYSSTAVIQDGDILTFQLVLSNTGTSAATVSYFCATPSDNLSTMSNLSSTGGSNGGITTNASCAGSTARRLNISGSKPTGNPNWVVTFNAEFQSQTQDGYEVCSNDFRVVYSDPSASNQSAVASYGPILCKTNKGKSPDVREVAP